MATATAALCAAGFSVAAVDTRQVRDFARAAGRPTEIDAPDAEASARFAEAVEPGLRPVPNAQARALGEPGARLSGSSRR